MTTFLLSTLWALTTYAFFAGSKKIFRSIANLMMRSLGIQSEERRLKNIHHVLFGFQQLLESGLSPQASDWVKLERMPAPWGALATSSLKELRAQGASVLPTLRRLKGLVEQHSSSLADSRAKSSQALAQAVVCIAMVPVFSALLWLLLPGLKASGTTWILSVIFATAVACLGGIWILHMSEQARWGGIEANSRLWVLAAQCALERCLALLRCGIPVDLAWARSIEALADEAPSLAVAWGASVWSSCESSQLATSHFALRSKAQQLFLQAGSDCKKSMQVSLMEGSPCGDRLETVLRTLQTDFRAEVDRQVMLLATRALKPLFTCVAPALFGILTVALYIVWNQMGASGN